MLNRIPVLARFFLLAVRDHGGYRALLSLVWLIYREEGVKGILRRLPIGNRSAIDASRLRQETYAARTLVRGACPGLSPHGGIAVVAHVFYPELFKDMAGYLGSIPWKFDLYISVTGENARTVVMNLASAIPEVAHLEVTVVPNRGRDIAPMLVEFAAAIRAHRYVLHIHTKKSLYSGYERTEWRDYLLMGLLGSEERVRHIFSQFEEDPSIGMVYPDTHGGLPYWAHTWLQNRGIALALGNRLGIDIRHMNYIDAPFGSMFWARSDALKPLLDLGMGFADFPDELGQIDGTLQHSIERFFVLATNLAGMSHRVTLDAEDGATLFLSPGRKNLHQYFASSPQDRIAAGTHRAQIVSFDIFDTLLVRPWFAPDNLFDFMELIVAQRFGIREFARLRQEAEHLARLRSRNSDVGIADIYAEFAALIQDPEQAPMVRALEEHAEWATLAPNAEVCEAARALAAKGKRLVAVSDMYLEEDFLRRLLNKSDLDIFAAIYVSNSVGKRKDDGTMWRELPRWQDTEAGQWVHVGDNEHSDVQRPLIEGFAVPVHVMKAADQFRLFNETATEWIRPRHWQEGLLLGLLANRIFLKGRAYSPIVLDNATRNITITSLRDFGYLVIGPALTAFMAWLLAEARRERISMLLYVSREGHLLKRAHDLISESYDTSNAIGLPAASYFLSSRTTACFAALNDTESVELFLKARFKGSFADLLRLRIGIEDLAPFVSRLGEESLFRAGELPIDRPRYRDLLGKCMDLLADRAATERELYRRYASSLIGEHRAALVDIGYSATIQRALATFLDGIAGGFYFVTLDQAHRAGTSGQFVKGCFGEKLNPFTTELPMFKYSLLLEAAMTAPHGQFRGFDADGNPRYKEHGRGQKHFAQIDEIHQGALDFLGESLAVAGEAFEAIGQHHAAAQLPIQQVIDGGWKLNPAPEALCVEDDFSGVGEVSVFEIYNRERKAVV